MSQVVHDKYAQMVKVDSVDLIPAAIVAAQTRDGKDELIVGAGAMVFDSGSGMWLPVSAANRLPVEATLTGRTEPIYEEALPVAPLGSNGTYTSPIIDCKEFAFPDGSTGVVSISALALSDAQGTLYLEARNTTSESWVRIASVAVNNTGRGV